MEALNPFQTKFFQALASIQEECVCAALAQKGTRPLEEQFYELSAGVILRVMEIIDGYADAGLGRLDVVCERTGEHLEPVFISGECRMDEGFFRQTRKFYAGILTDFKEN